MVHVNMVFDQYFVLQNFEFVDLHLLLVMFDVDYQHFVKVIVYELLFFVLFVDLIHFLLSKKLKKKGNSIFLFYFILITLDRP
jgi:hypothetical protein